MKVAKGEDVDKLYIQWPFDEPFTELVKAEHHLRQLINVCVLLEEKEKFSLANVVKPFTSKQMIYFGTLATSKKVQNSVSDGIYFFKKNQRRIRSIVSSERDTFQTLKALKKRWKITQLNGRYSLDISYSLWLNSIKSDFEREFFKLKVFVPYFTGDPLQPLSDEGLILKCNEDACYSLDKLLLTDIKISVSGSIGYSISKYKYLATESTLNNVLEALQENGFMEELWRTLVCEIQNDSLNYVHDHSKEASSNSCWFVRVFEERILEVEVKGMTIQFQKVAWKSTNKQPPSTSMAVFFSNMLSGKLRERQNNPISQSFLESISFKAERPERKQQTLLLSPILKFFQVLDHQKICQVVCNELEQEFRVEFETFFCVESLMFKSKLLLVNESAVVNFSVSDKHVLVKSISLQNLKKDIVLNIKVLSDREQLKAFFKTCLDICGEEEG